MLPFVIFSCLVSRHMQCPLRDFMWTPCSSIGVVWLSLRHQRHNGHSLKCFDVVPGRYCLNSSFCHNTLVDVSIFFIFSCSGEGKGVSWGQFVIENPRRGGLSVAGSVRGGEGLGGCLRGISGGGANYFLGAEIPTKIR